MLAAPDHRESRSPGTWLICDGRVLATLEIAADRRGRRRGLLGRNGIDGAMMLAPARSVHTLGMRFAIDVAHLDADGRVLRIVSMKRNRVGSVVWRSRSVIECEQGSFDRWGVRVGDILEVR